MIADIIKIIMARNTLSSAEESKKYLLNLENIISIAIGGKTKPKDEKKKLIIGGKNDGKYAFFL